MTPSTGAITRDNYRALVMADEVLFGTIDDDYAGFLLVALSRAILGKHTAGLFLRPHTCFSRKRIVFRAKKLVFRMLKCISKISVFTIVPNAVAPEFGLVAKGHVMDPQMWDVSGQEETSDNVTRDSNFARCIRETAKGRRILAFVGTVGKSKGIGFLADLIGSPQWPHQAILPVVAGKFPTDDTDLSSRLTAFGAAIIDRHITDTELVDLYRTADYIWCCYHPDYDQASGVFGRAIQFQKIPVVRRGSLVADMCHHLSIDAWEMDYADTRHPLDGLPPLDTPKKISLDEISSWQRDFAAAVNSALSNERVAKA